MLSASIGDFDEAQMRFERALRFDERIPAPAYAARTRYWYARMLLDRNDPGDDARAKNLLDDCLAKAREFGMAALVESAERLK